MITRHWENRTILQCKCGCSPGKGPMVAEKLQLNNTNFFPAINNPSAAVGFSRTQRKEMQQGE